MQNAAWLLVALPVLSAAVLLLGGRRTDRWGHLLGAAVPIALFGYGLLLFLDVRGLPAEERSRDLHLWSWIPVGNLQLDFGLLLDPLSLTFVLLITGVGGLIHIYAVGYMEHDPGRRRFFGYFNLFLAAMLLLVLGDNFVVLYLGWEGVGLASYLLIAWYTDRPSAATAAKKAFIMNRVGDAGLAIAIFLMFSTFGVVSFSGVFGAVGGASEGVVTALGLLLLLGACGKSGQIPLQAWLPDAMEGPTPVSALIHAATMVTAGVYLIARANPIYDAAPTAQLAVVIVGAATLLYGAIIGAAKDDIKRVLAYSTVSQIGYMFLAVGLGPGIYALGILHLLTHGFFKAGLFLGAGSVMHGMNDQVDMRRFGGLWKVMPVTFWTFTAGYLALIGLPPLSGFFSKDPIIEAAFDREGWSGWVFGGVALLAVGLTAYYMTRLMLMTFFGKRRWTDDVHPHESPPVMTVPMLLLAVGSVGAGFFLVTGDRLAHWLEPVLGEEQEVVHKIDPLGVSILTVVFALGGIAAAWFVFGRSPVPTTEPVRVSPITVAARRNLYADAFNEAVFMRPGQWLDRFLVWFDNRGVDGAVNGVAAGLGGGSGRLRRLQTGFVRSYALSMLGGSVLVVASLLAVRFV
ncbi:MAG TPA: NADH-quinone oxidoreductase subunit L [Mycobacteriales bacterium]|nr:NADH-quinone oxidoreductase subunit L [Mycobacteriales bacterium]